MIYTFFFFNSNADHPWIKEDGEASDKPLDNAVLSRMKQFRAMNKLKKMALNVIAENLSEEEIIGLKEMFKALDTDKNGIVTLEELRTGLPKLGNKISEAEIKQLMEAVSLLVFSLPLAKKTKAYYYWFWFFRLIWMEMDR